MQGAIARRLGELGIVLPKPVAPVATYVPCVIAGGLAFLSGQVPVGPAGLEYRGKLGRDISLEDGQKAARLCALNLLAQLGLSLGGDFDRVRACVKLGGFVNAVPEFQDHPKVINGASDLIVAVMGEAGRHARFAVGAPSLPFDVAVEIDAVFAVSG